MLSEPDLAYLAQQIVNAIPIAALYGLLAFGYGLSFGLTRRPDFIAGALFAFAGQAFVIYTGQGWNQLWLIYPAALGFGAIIALLLVLGVAWIIAVAVTRPLVLTAPTMMLVASIGVMIVLMEAARIAAGGHQAWLSPFLVGHVILWKQPQFIVMTTWIKIIVTLIAAFALLAGVCIMEKTRAGRVWRAVADDVLGAALCGVDGRHVFMLSTLATAVMAWLAGVLATVNYGAMDFGAGLIFGLKVVMIAAIGASSSPGRAAIGAALYGLAETIWAAYLPFEWRDLAMFGLLVVFAVLSKDRTGRLSGAG